MDRFTTTPPRISVRQAQPAPMCLHCWGQRAIWESSLVGMLPVQCERCTGSGREPPGRIR
jgi:hypothetical protein